VVNNSAINNKKGDGTTGRQGKADQCIWLRIYLQNQWPMRLPVSFSAEETTAVLPVMDSARVADS
jgi:hypothetical protein